MKIKISPYGYYYYSTRTGKTVYLHREVYEMHYGPIPDGFIVHHKDGDKTNNSLENLELLSRAEHASLHHKGKKKSEEMKKKSSETKMGHIVSRDTREKISLKLKGRKLSNETRMKMRAAQKARRKKEAKN